MQGRPYSFELTAERSLTPLHDRRVLDAIHKHQNPARCDTAKYLVHSLAHRHNGFGSTLHVLARRGSTGARAVAATARFSPICATASGRLVKGDVSDPVIHASTHTE